MLNSVFLHHCVEAGLDLAMVNPNHITPYGEITEAERALADDLVFNRREDALELFIAHFETKGEEEAAEVADPTAGMEPEEALHWHILRRKKDGVEDWIDRSVEKIGAVPTLNDVLLPAMKEVGDKFGAGELILPFVLQSAEVMKRAVARLEGYLDKLEGYTKGTVVVATVFGDVHDIGKSLVNTILTNNGYTVIDLGKQVPIGTIIEAAKEHDATAIGLSALLVSTSKQMPAVHPGAPQRGPRVPRPARRRGDQPRLRPARALPRRARLRRGLRAGRLLLQGRLRGPGQDGPDRRRRGARRAGGQDARGRARACVRRAPSPSWATPPTPRCAPPPAPTRPCPSRPFWGTREIDVPLDEVYHHLDTHVLFKLHWGGRGVKGEAWRTLVDEDFRPRLERMWREASYLHPKAKLGYFPCYSEGNEVVVLDPEDRETVLERFVFPRQPKHSASAWPTSTARRTAASSTSSRCQAVTAGDEVTELMAQLEADGEFAEQLFVHGLGVQTAEGIAEWLHACASPRPRRRRSTRAGATRGATPRAPSSQSTRSSSACSTRRRSACA